jgi:isocitrate dehydrogenase kinase/phosphatase
MYNYYIIIQGVRFIIQTPTSHSANSHVRLNGHWVGIQQLKVAVLKNCDNRVSELLSFVQCVVTQHRFDQVRWSSISDKFIFVLEGYFGSKYIVL